MVAAAPPGGFVCAAGFEVSITGRRGKRWGRDEVEVESDGFGCRDEVSARRNKGESLIRNTERGRERESEKKRGRKGE